MALVFVVSGCQKVVQYRVICAGSRCVTQQLRTHPYEQPQRLRTNDQLVWKDPKAPAAPATDTPAEALVDSMSPGMTGQRTTDVNDPRYKPTLPRAMGVAGARAVGHYEICVDDGGQVESVRIVKSAWPGLDASWIAKMERWQYEPYRKNGQATRFCHPARIEVRVQD